VRKLLTVFLLLMVLSVSGCSSSNLVLEGIVQTNVYSQYSEVAGRISGLSVDLGQMVKAGDLIAEIDAGNELYALDQLKTTLGKKQATLAGLKAGGTIAERKMSQNNVNLAQIALKNAELTDARTRKDYEDAKILFREGTISESDLDNVKYQADLAGAAVAAASLQLDNAKQQLILLEEGARKEEIAVAEADVRQTESQIRQAEENLTKYMIKAVADGTVISINYLAGNIVAPGYNLADIASEKEKYLVAYIPKEYLDRVSFGQELTLRSGKDEYSGKVIFIDVKAEYTPKEMQTSANKNKESMRIKVNLSEDNPLKVGERAELLISL